MWLFHAYLKAQVHRKGLFARFSCENGHGSFTELNHVAKLIEAFSLELTSWF